MKRIKFVMDEIDQLYVLDWLDRAMKAINELLGSKGQKAAFSMADRAHLQRIIRELEDGEAHTEKDRR